MSVDRRSVLKGMALSGIAGLAAAGPLRALAVSAPHLDAHRGCQLLALVAEGAAGALFLQGIAASGAAPAVCEASADPLFLTRLENQLRGDGPLRVIGLLDDAAASLAVDVARSAGARVLWLGQHSAQALCSRHQLLTADAAGQGAGWFADQLHASGSDFTLHTTRLDGPSASCQRTGSPRSTGHPAQWASSVGYLLASPGGAALAEVPPLPASSPSVRGSFVSFAIEA